MFCFYFELLYVEIYLVSMFILLLSGFILQLETQERLSKLMQYLLNCNIQHKSRMFINQCGW